MECIVNGFLQSLMLAALRSGAAKTSKAAATMSFWRCSFFFCQRGKA